MWFGSKVVVVTLRVKKINDFSKDYAAKMEKSCSLAPSGGPSLWLLGRLREGLCGGYCKFYFFKTHSTFSKVHWPLTFGLGSWVIIDSKSKKSFWKYLKVRWKRLDNQFRSYKLVRCFHFKRANLYELFFIFQGYFYLTENFISNSITNSHKFKFFSMCSPCFMNFYDLIK